MSFSATGTFSCPMTRLSQTLAACSRAARSSAMRQRTSWPIRRRLGGRSLRHSRFRRTDSRSRSRRLRSLRTRRSNTEIQLLALGFSPDFAIEEMNLLAQAPELLLLLQESNLIHTENNTLSHPTLLMI